MLVLLSTYRKVLGRISTATEELRHMAVVACIEGVDSRGIFGVCVVQTRHNSCPQVEPGVRDNLKDGLVSACI